ncbi:hypothetical protein FRC0201_00789 [Corynebacterium diphtheriae]|nr:hypothetical protein FRC0026_00519 [Corynebacterium diphtheriae]CAB0793059.1 hypothetical protein FRC0201_00789 [Corynebacterium diphtheriae]CAB0928097.1 hypothetical protein FRC0435_00980 [Corynebacterium diphtheriae]CAB0928276.1 hypothetical protein FRC0434_00983 [Corynebacterium diphtheriae]CAB0959866.1 hypothetical protein FRC0482_00830 [Corynebacterium diphtheriae]
MSVSCPKDAGLVVGSVVVVVEVLVVLVVVLNVSQKVTGFWQETDMSVQGGAFRVVATYKNQCREGDKGNASCNANLVLLRAA